MYKYEFIRCGLVQNNDSGMIRPDQLTFYLRRLDGSVAAKLEVFSKDVRRIGKCHTVLESAQQVATFCCTTLSSLTKDSDGNREDTHEAKQPVRRVYYGGANLLWGGHLNS